MGPRRSSSNDPDSHEYLLHHSRENSNSTMLRPGFRSWPMLKGRRLLFATCACLASASLCGLLSIMIWTHQFPFHISKNAIVVPEWSPPKVLKGPATDSLWDNLLNDTKYISSWPSAGWTNDVMTYANLVYLAQITDRVPVLPPFVPSHIGGEAGLIPFGEVFNVTRLSQAIGIPVIEWRDLKKNDSGVKDEIGCWDVWEASQQEEHRPRISWLVDVLNLDISYTPAPGWVKMSPIEVHDLHTTFWGLAALAFPQTNAEEHITPHPSEAHGVSLPPNLHFVCYDYLYYVGAQRAFEFGRDYSPGWRFSAVHMRWTDHLERLAEKFVRKALSVPDGEPTPLYIVIHARHHDFKVYCGDLPLEDCFASPAIIARRVREVQDELLSTKGIFVKDVIMTSDEDDPGWWAEVAELGFKYPDHSKTEEEYGRWYPLLIDAVIQSGGIGFVGTDRSTMSEIALRRCQSWHGAVTRLVKWGHIGADDH